MKKITTFLATFYFIGNLYGQATLPFEEYFEDGVINSNMVPFPNVVGMGGVIEIDDGIGYDDTKGLKIGKLNDNPGFATNALDLYLDLSTETDVELSFWIQSVYDNNHPEDGIFFSDDGGDFFIKVIDFVPEDWCAGVYGKHPPIDVDELASNAGLDLTSQFIIRFQQKGEHDFLGGSSNLDGFYLDEIKVYNPNLEYATIPFEDDFEDGVFKAAWAHNFADNTSSSPSGDAITTPMNLVDVVAQYGVDDSYGVRMGRRCDGTFVTNALDLHLNLLNETDVELSFWIQSVYDNNHPEDGIYFSNDGGGSFIKVIDFVPEEWCADVYGKHPPIDVDELASSAGLDLTSQFIIRFQQKGEHDFLGGSSNLDGFYLDEVKVYNPNLEYATIPFEDDFEDGVFKAAWAHNFADNTSSSPSGDAITTPMNLVEVVAQYGVDDSYGVRMGRRCDGTFVTNALDLYLDLSTETDVELSFWIQSVYDNNHPEDGIYFSDDGGDFFIKVIDFVPEEWCAGVYGKHPPIDVDELASSAGLDLTSQFIIRFQQRGEHDFLGGSSNLDGFYLDEVKVYDPNLEYATLPFEDDFEDGVFKAAWAHNFADNTSGSPSGDAITTPMNLVEVVAQYGVDDSYGVRMGRRCDGTFVTNALDLHLNLLNETDVELSFWMNSIYEDSHPEDGIYFSGDNGVSFVKIFGFDFSTIPPNEYLEYKLDIDDLVSQNFLEYSEQSIIRFQQRGEHDFLGGASNLDGYYLDDVNIAKMTTSTESFLTRLNFQISPNPTKDILNLNVDDGYRDKISRIAIIDVLGELHFPNSNQSSGGWVLDLSNLPSGIYFLTITFDDQTTHTERVIKK